MMAVKTTPSQDEGARGVHRHRICKNASVTHCTLPLFPVASHWRAKCRRNPNPCGVWRRLSRQAHTVSPLSAAVGDLVKTYKFEHQPTKTAMHGWNLRYVSARASFRAGKSKNGNYRLRQK